MGIKFRPGLESVGIDGGMVEKWTQKDSSRKCKKTETRSKAEKLEVEKFASFSFGS